jgi:hypothetical protein
LPALILPVVLFLAQVVVSWLEHASSLLFFLQCFLILALATRFLADGELALPRWWLHLFNLAVHRSLQLLVFVLCGPGWLGVVTVLDVIATEVDLQLWYQL